MKVCVRVVAWCSKIYKTTPLSKDVVPTPKEGQMAKIMLIIGV